MRDRMPINPALAVTGRSVADSLRNAVTAAVASQQAAKDEAARIRAARAADAAKPTEGSGGGDTAAVAP